MKLVHRDTGECCDWEFLMGGLPAGKNSEETQCKELFFLSSLPPGTPIRVVAGHGEQLDTTSSRFSEDIAHIREQLVAIHVPWGVQFDTAHYETLVLQYESQTRKRQVQVQAVASV